MYSELIKQARRTANISQKELAEKLGLSEKTISAYEKNRAIPPAPTLQKIATITNQPITFFLDNGIRHATLDDIAEKLDTVIAELKKINKNE